MIRISTDHYSIYAIDENGVEHVLFNGESAIDNYSLVPLWKFNDCKIAIEYLIDILDQYLTITENTNEHNLSAFVIGCMVADRIKTLPYHAVVTEIGCSSGCLSYMLAEVMGLFDSKSSVCGVTNIIGNDSGNYWIDYVSMVKKPCKFSMLASDYDDCHLASGESDIVVVNGNEEYENPEVVMLLAFRLLKRDGLLVVHSANSFFERYVGEIIKSNGKRIKIDTKNSIYIVSNVRDIKLYNKQHLEDSLGLDIIEYCRRILNSKECNKAMLGELLQKVENEIKNAVNADKRLVKLELIKIHEELVRRKVIGTVRSE